MLNRKSTSRSGDKLKAVNRNATVPSFPSEAPRVLTRLYEKHPDGQIAAILYRLLTDARMRLRWRDFSKKINDDLGWMELWRAIQIAVMDSRSAAQMPIREDEHRAFSLIAKKAKDLAKLTRDGKLDLLAYEMLQPDYLELIGIEGWEGMNSLERGILARSALRYWPSFPEMLDRLAFRATELAGTAKSTPRIIQHKTRDARMIAFVCLLAAYFKSTFGTPLYGTLAIIAGVILQKNYDKTVVVRALNRRNLNKTGIVA